MQISEMTIGKIYSFQTTNIVNIIFYLSKIDDEDLHEFEIYSVSWTEYRYSVQITEGVYFSEEDWSTTPWSYCHNVDSDDMHQFIIDCLKSHEVEYL